MPTSPHIPLHRLVLSLSGALDHVSPAVADHQLRVAYISSRMGRVLGYERSALRSLFHAAAFHDIGLIKARNRVRAVAHSELEGLGWHAEAGYQLLKDDRFFGDAASAVRYHHVRFSESADRDDVPNASFIIGLADAADRALGRNKPVLMQSDAVIEQIRQGRGDEFAPDCVDAFTEVASVPAFWLDLTSPRIYSILSSAVDWPIIAIDEKAVGQIARIFGRIVDSLSPWTGTHTAGVAATAVALSRYLHFSPHEQALMQAAGFLHDLGKVAIPGAILDKPGKPDAQEWAVLREHTYHTFRVLETIGGMPQICEWAAYHHERLDGKGYPFGYAANRLTLGARIMAVGDIFTALTEDRPYRHGFAPDKAVAIIEERVADGGLDGWVVATLRDNLSVIDGIRREEQAAWLSGQAALAGLMEEPSREKVALAL